MRVDLEKMAEVVAARTFEEVSLDKEITGTEVIANQVRLKHQAALGANIETQKLVIFTETQSQEQNGPFCYHRAFAEGE